MNESKNTLNEKGIIVYLGVALLIIYLLPLLVSSDFLPRGGVGFFRHIRLRGEWDMGGNSSIAFTWKNWNIYETDSESSFHGFYRFESRSIVHLRGAPVHGYYTIEFEDGRLCLHPIENQSSERSCYNRIEDGY